MGSVMASIIHKIHLQNLKNRARLHHDDAWHTQNILCPLAQVPFPEWIPKLFQLRALFQDNRNILAIEGQLNTLQIAVQRLC